MGLFEGTGHLQYLYETNAAVGYNLFNVDILNVGEVINVLGCGLSAANNIRVTISDPSGNQVYDSTTGGSICDSDLNTTFDPATTPAHQYVTTSTGTYVVSFSNVNGTYLSRYDVTVTNNTTDLIDPRLSSGRVWSDYWYFNANGFGANRATDANLYVVADGGFIGTYFVWRLDLNNFAGFVYALKANDLGVTSPNGAGDVVAGLSVPVTNNSIQEKYPIYLGYPAKSFPSPIGGLNVSGLGFVDSDGEDSGISPGSTSSVQDSGTFQFSTDLTTTGVYEIIIDSGSASGGGPDGVYGQGDIFLRGNAFSGLNSVVWNGEDNNGNIIPEGAYTASLSVRAGEFHFTAEDVETSGGAGEAGIKIYRAQASGGDLPTTIFWDDETVLGSTAPNAFNQEGIFDGDHNWGSFNSGGIGNNSYIDTYSYGLVQEPNPIGVAITENDIPLPTIAKSFFPSSITTGGTSTLELEITYNGVLGLTNIEIVDNMPNGMTLVTDPSSISVTGAGCSGFVFSASTVVGGAVLEVIDGNIAANSVCTISAEVTASLPGEMVNTSSGVVSSELADGVVSNGASLFVLPAPGGPTLSCDSQLFELDTIGSSTRLYSVNRNAVPYSRQEFTSASYSPTSGYTYTGLAYNPIDNYLYAIVNQSDELNNNPRIGSILRIDQDGVVVDMGVPVGGPNTMEMPVISDRYVGGTIGKNGRYIVVTDLSATSSTGANIPVVERGLILDIDLSSSPPEVLFNRRHGRDIGDIVAHPDGNYYSYNNIERLISIEPANGFVSVVGGDITDSVNGLTVDPFGVIYAHTDAAEMYRLDVVSGNGTLLSTLAASSASDAASCGFGVGLHKTVDAVDIAPGTSATYTLSIANATDSVAVFDVTDALGDARTLVADSLVNPLGGTVNNYAGTSTLTITSATLAPNSSADIQFDVYYPPSYPLGNGVNQASINVVGSGVVESDSPDTVITPDGTIINVLPNTSVGVSKRAIVSGNDITYEIKIDNLGNTVADSLVLTDDLDAVFGAGNYALTLAPVLVDNPGTLTLAAGFDGTTPNSTLLGLADGNSLAVGASALIRFALRVTSITNLGAGTGVFSNQVELFTEDLDGNPVSDLSVDGSETDPDGNGFPDEQSPTVTTLVQLIEVQGVVFVDNGIDSAITGGVSHDGLQSAAEISVAGITVEARDGSNVITSTVTADDGSYTLSLPASFGGNAVQIVTTVASGYKAVSEFFREDPANTGSVSDGSVSFTPQLSFAGAYRIDFGVVADPVWEADRIEENLPAATVSLQHRYLPGSDGQVSFAIQNQSATPLNSAWQAVLYLDNNCNGSLDSGEQAIPPTFDVDIDSTPLVCVISRVFVPSDTSADDNFSYAIKATLTYSDAAGTGLVLQDIRTVTDLVRVIADGEGLLELSKSVQNLTSGGGATTSNSGIPGDLLRYVIGFSNSGSGQITDLLISDSTPAFTVLSAPVVCPIGLPAGLTSCQVLAPSPSLNSAGYSGSVQWLFGGALLAGASGEVDYTINIE